MRIPKQVLIIPYRIIDDKIEYCIFKRKDMDAWQWIAGGAEDFDKDIIESAKREFFEETEYKWVDYKEAKSLLRYDSNKSALWELDVKLKKETYK